MIGRVCSLLRMQPPLVVNRGLLFGSGTVVPTDGTDGWQTGAIFQKTDGSGGTTLYVNEGSVTSCVFKALAGARLVATGASKVDGIDYNYTTATTYGSGGDRWGGSGSMEAFLSIGDDQAASVVSGAGTHLGQYINLSYTGTAGNANDLLGGFFTCLTYGANQTQGKVCGITSYIRNPDKSVKGSGQECNAIRALMYTGSSAETQHYCGILVSVLDMTSTKSAAQDITGMRVQFNIGNAAAGGNVSGIVLDNVGTVEADAGLWFLNNKWTYAMWFADGGASPKPATDSGTVSGSQAGVIKIKVGGGTVRYIPLYSDYTA